MSSFHDIKHWIQISTVPNWTDEMQKSMKGVRNLPIKSALSSILTTAVLTYLRSTGRNRLAQLGRDVSTKNLCTHMNLYLSVVTYFDPVIRRTLILWKRVENTQSRSLSRTVTNSGSMKSWSWQRCRENKMAAHTWLNKSRHTRLNIIF